MKKNLLLISSVMSTIFASSLIAEAATLDELNTQMEDVRTETPIGSYGAYMTTARPKVDVHGEKIYFAMDAIYWKAAVGSTDYAYSANSPFATKPTKGSNKDISFGFDWGLRVGAGLHIDHGDWDLSGQYTYFQSNARDSYTAGINSSAVPLRAYLGITDVVTGRDFKFCTKTYSQFSLDMNSGEVILSRNYYNSSKLSFNPHFGLKGAWINLNQVTKYSGGDTSPPLGGTGLGDDNVKVSDASRFGGVGPKAGFDSKWYLDNGFSVFGNIGASLIWGHVHVNHKERFSHPPVIYPTHIVEGKVGVSSSNSQFVPHADMQLGLVYDTYINEKQQHLSISAGYDLQYYFRINQMLLPDVTKFIEYGYDKADQDLSMHGLTITAKLDF